ncbi:MAG: hypothetical protein ACTSRR_02295 [Candidatus Heimdallarchaeaceae archaeon]
MIFWIVTGIYLFGIAAIFILERSSQFITKLFPLLKGRMRIVFNYINVLITICAYIVYLYTVHPFSQSTKILEEFVFSPFSSIFLALSTLLISVTGFFLMSDVDEFSNKSKIGYISLLFTQYSAFIMFSSISWVFIYLGLLGIIVGITFILRNIYLKREAEVTKELHSMFVFDILSLVFLFLGILFYNLVFNSFIIQIKSRNNFWALELLSFIFIFCSSLVLLEIPPFHFRSFFEINKKFKTPKIINLLKKLVGVFMIINLSRPISVNSNYRQFYFIVFLTIGGIVSLWGAVGTINKLNINELLVYIDFYYIGTLLLFLSNNFSPNSTISASIEGYAFILFLTIFYFMMQIVQTSLTSLMSSKYSISSLDDLLKGEKLEKIEVFPFAILQFVEIAFPLALSYTYIFYLNFNNLSTLYFIVLTSIISVNFFFGIQSSFRVIYYSLKKTSLPLGYKRIEPNLHIASFVSMLILIFNAVFIKEIVIVCQKAVFLFPF